MSAHAQTQNILMIDHLHDGGALGAAGRRHQAGVAFGELHHRIHPSAGMSVRLHLAVIFNLYVRLMNNLIWCSPPSFGGDLQLRRNFGAVHPRCSPPSFGGDLQSFLKKGYSF